MIPKLLYMQMFIILSPLVTQLLVRGAFDPRGRDDVMGRVQIHEFEKFKMIFIKWMVQQGSI